ncbi:MAG: ABC transporter permease [Gammaproteobacteria bacterium]
MVTKSIAIQPYPWWSRLPYWRGGLVLLAAFLALPLLTVLGFSLQPAGDVWRHLQQTVLAEYVRNSLLLALGVGAGTLVIGVCTAWLTSLCEFPGRRFMQWALLLPLAMPAYIIAYTYSGMLDFSGPVQSALREAFSWSSGEYWFPQLRSLGGAIAMLSLVLYPYVYMLARAAFLEQSVCVLEVSRTLGRGPWRSFFTVALPLARPAVVVGASLVLMETLADYGTVKYFGLSTFTTGIFRTWFGHGDAAAAAQLSAVMMVFVFLLIVLERFSRRQAAYHHTSSRYKALPRYRLTGMRSALALAACLLPISLGFLVPAGQLLAWAAGTAAMLDAPFLDLVLNSLMLAGIASSLTLIIALFLAYGRRANGSRLLNAALHVASLGYATPGTVIAVGVMVPFAWLDNTLDAWLRENFGISSGLLLSGTLASLLFAYVVRFVAIALHSVEAGLEKIRPTMDEAARSLGKRPWEVLCRVHVPVIWGTLLSAGLLVFVDVLKELPATLVLRPFNFNTLAVRAFELASDERLMDSASAAIAIVAAGILPVILLSRSISRARPGHDTPT